MRAVILLVAAAIAATAATPHSALAAPREDSGRINPRFLLVDTNGQAVTDEDFRGRFQLITFGYTSCPDVCPTTLAKIGALLRALGAESERVQPLFITVDPQRDTVESLRGYMRSFDPRIRALTGSADLIRSAAEHFHVIYRRTDDTDPTSSSYGIEHTAGLYLIGPEGEFRARLAVTTPLPELVRRIREELGADGLRARPGEP